VEPFIWNYLVENDTEGKDSIGVPENNAEDKDSIGILDGPQLTPPSATVISPMMVNNSSNKKQKLNKVTSIDRVPLNGNDYTSYLVLSDKKMGSTHLIPQYKRTCELYWQS
jgi:hypothetical protein